MPSPWEMSPQEKWAQNFRNRVTAVTDNISDEGVERYKAGVEAAFERGGVNLEPADVSKSVSAFEDSVDNFSDEAMKRTTAAAAARYLETLDEVPDVISDEADEIEGNTEYDDTSGSDSEFEAATVVLGNKFIQNWADSYRE